jgi:hypothetical protein
MLVLSSCIGAVNTHFPLIDMIRAHTVAGRHRRRNARNTLMYRTYEMPDIHCFHLRNPPRPDTETALESREASLIARYCGRAAWG